MTEERLSSLYESDGFGGEKTMRAKVIRELIDEIRVLRRELEQAEGRSLCPTPTSDGKSYESLTQASGIPRSPPVPL